MINSNSTIIFLIMMKNIFIFEKSKSDGKEFFLMLQKITTLDAVFITLMAACGLALKPIVGPIGKIIGTIFFIPGGSFSGAVYMIWPMLAVLVVQTAGAALLVGLIEGVIVMITGIYGSHGVLSFVTYLMPCLMIDMGYFLLKNVNDKLAVFIPPALGNTTGALLVGYFFLHLPNIPLLISLIPAFIFGAIGGYFSIKLYQLLIKNFPQFSKQRNF